ncbi:MAG: TolC family protein [bacterium]
MASVCRADTVEPEIRYLPLNLRTCLILTLKHNLLLADLRLSPEIDQTKILQEEAVFDPTLSAQGDYKESRTPRASRLFGTVFEEDQANTSLGISKKFASGASTDLTVSNLRANDSSPFRVLKPSQNSTLALKITQPLLKNFGWEVNETDIKIALNQRKGSILALKDSVIKELHKTVKLYWDLVFAYQNKQVKEVLLKQARGLLEMNRAKVALGVLAPIVITEARAGIASRQEAIILAEAGIRDIVDQLLAQTNLAGDSWDFLIKPEDKPTSVQANADLKDMLEKAFQYRPDYLSLLLDLKTRDFRIRYYDNQQNPELDLYGSFGYTGLSDDFGDSWDNLSRFNYPGWSVGLNASYPLGNRKSSGLYLQRRLEKQQAEIRIKRLKQTVMLEVRKAFRQLKSGWKRIQATLVSRQLEKEKLHIELEKLKLGKSTSQRILDFQSDLAEAKINYLQAVIDYNKSLSDLYKTSGTLLSKYNIDISQPVENIDISTLSEAADQRDSTGSTGGSDAGR